MNDIKDQYKKLKEITNKPQANKKFDVFFEYTLPTWLILCPISFIFEMYKGALLSFLIFTISLFFILLYLVLKYDYHQKDNNKPLILNKEQIEEFYQPLSNYWGIDKLAENLALDLENDQEDNREIGDISLIEDMYLMAIDEIKYKEKVGNFKEKIKTIVE